MFTLVTPVGPVAVGDGVELGPLLAWLLSRALRPRGVARTVGFTPSVLSAVAPGRR